MYRYNKYGNHKVVIDSITFDSKKEANRYLELKMLVKKGYIKSLILQPRFEVIPKQKTERNVWYIADFMYIDNDTNDTVVEDVKSKATMTPQYIIKRKLFKLKYPNIVFKEILQ